MEDADIRAVEPIAIVKIAAAAQAMMGVLVALTGLQMTGIYGYGSLEWIEYVPYAQMPIGVGLVFLATMVFRARTWAALGGAVACAVVTLLMGAWDFFCITQELFSCLSLLSFPVGCLATILAFVAIGPVKVAAAARARLSAQGMGLGL